MNDSSFNKIVILGGGSAGWMTAAALANAFGPSKKIVLIESEAIGTVGVGEATIPAIRAFNRLLGIKESEFLKSTYGTFKLGINFEGWGAIDDDYMHAFGNVGKDSWMAGFLHFWLKAKALDDVPTANYWDYSLNAVAAKSRRFSLDPQSGLEYAYHFDATRYAKVLRQYSEKLGVIRKEGMVSDVRCNSSTGFVDALELDSGEHVGGDFFIDCSGFKSILNRGAMNGEFEDWSDWLICDRAVTAPSSLLGSPNPYTRSIAHSCGWRWEIPLQHRMGNGLVYSSQSMSDDEAAGLLLSSLSGKSLSSPNTIKFTAGRVRTPWIKNCVSIGLSSGFLEPLESTSLHFVQTAITRLIQRFPRNSLCPATIEEYNAQAKFEAESARDFILLHYYATTRSDSDFWNYCRNMTIPQSLQAKIDTFKATASVFRQQDEIFHEGSWQQVMLGQGLNSSAFHPVVDALSDSQLWALLQRVERGVEQKILNYSDHGEILMKYCPAATVGGLVG